MELPKTPKYSKSFSVPATPLLKQIGYGTGVGVYHMERSPKVGLIQSPWAIKKLNKNLPQGNASYALRLKKEAEVLKLLSHPNIVGFRGFTETDDGRVVLAMEECDHCLGVLIEERREAANFGPYEPAKIYFVIGGICKALDYLHSNKKMIHGDIKSYNVLIEGNFMKAKLCDFGVSLSMNEDGEADMEDFIGTCSWSAPETFEEGPLTPKSDIFSLGLVIWEMLALNPPHSGELNSELSDEELEEIEEEKYGTRPSLENLSLGLEYSQVIDIFKWCTEQNFQERPNASDVLSKLKEIGGN